MDMNETDKSRRFGFSQLRFVITAFLNVAIGKLYGDFSGETIKEHLSVEHLKPEDVSKLTRAVRNGKDFYKNVQASN
jgi:hypothetical protein